MKKPTNFKVSLGIMILSMFALTGCPDSGSSTKNKPATYHNPLECSNQVVPAGIPGNTACPYQGEYDPNRGYQPYSVQYSAGISFGFYIDFGWDYKDMCPQDGQLPIFENGQFSRCSSVNPNFAGPFYGYSNRTMGECAGDQYSMDVTGCRPSLQPTQPW